MSIAELTGPEDYWKQQKYRLDLKEAAIISREWYWFFSASLDPSSPHCQEYFDSYNYYLSADSMSAGPLTYIGHVTAASTRKLNLYLMCMSNSWKIRNTFRS